MTDVRRTLRWALALVAVAVVIVVWYGHGRAPGLVADDWAFLANRRQFGHAHSVVGVLWRSRPGSALLFTVLFGAIGPHSGLLFTVQALANAGIVLTLFVLAHPHVGRVRAASIAGLWVLLPNHATVFMWASAMCATVAYLLLILGVIQLRDRRFPVGIVLLAAAGLTYEIVVPLAALVVAVFCVMRREWLRLAYGWAVLAAVTSWVVHFTPKNASRLWGADGMMLAQSQWGWGVWRFPHSDALAPIAIATLAAFAVWLLVHDPDDLDARLLLAGIAVTAAGVSLILPVRSSYWGLDDRFVGLAAIGTAMVYVGAGGLVRRLGTPPVVVALTIVLVASSWRLVGEQVHSYRWADASVRSSAERLAGDALPRPTFRHGVPGAGYGWDDSARVLLR